MTMTGVRSSWLSNGLTSRRREMQERWESGHVATRLYKDILAARVRAGMWILHAGCGWDKNEVSRPYKQHCRLVGIDLDPRVASMFHSEFYLGSISAMPFQDESFDLICSEYVLEHVEDPAAAFREIARVLKPGGRIVILTPNRNSYLSLAARLTPQPFHILMGQFRYGRGHEADMYPTYYRCNTSRQLKRQATAAGLGLAALHFVTDGPTWFVKLPVLFQLFNAYHLLIQHWQWARQFRCALVVEFEKPRKPAANNTAASTVGAIEHSGPRSDSGRTP
jgi:SAM-dependent methyltransferase